LSRWGNRILGNPVSVLAIMILLGVSAVRYTAGHLSIDTDTAQLIAPDAPFQQFSRRYEKAFSQDLHTLLLVVESDTPELTKTASKRLLRLLSADTEHIHLAYIPNDNAFFRQNGLLYLDVAELQTLSNNLSLAQPFIGRIAQQPNLSGFFSIFEDALSSADKAQVVPDLTALIDKVSQALHKTLNDGNALLSWESMIAENKPHAGDGFIIVSPKFDYSQIRPAKTSIESVRKAVADIQDPSLPAVKVWLTGEVGLEDDELAGVSTGTFDACIFSVVVVVFILLVAYRSVLLTLATLLTLALGMVFCGAFAAFAVTKLNLISLAFAVSNIGLGVEYAIHFCLRYRDNLRTHINKTLALRGTLTGTAPALMLSAGTTSIGLYAFIPTDYKGVSELGLLAGTSLFICLLITFITLPALLRITPAPSRPPDTQKPRSDSKWPERLAVLPLHYAKQIAFVTLVLAAVSIVLTFKVKTDFNPINLRDPNTESVIAFKNLMKDKETTPLTLTVLAKNEADARNLRHMLSTLASVDKTVSLFDFQPAEQDEKLALIEEISMMLGAQAQRFPGLISDPDPVPNIERLIKSIESILPQKTDPRERTALTAFKKELQDILIELDNRQQAGQQQLIEKIQTTLLGTLPVVMNELLAGLNAGNITLADLPSDIKSKWLSQDGSYRIQIYPKKDLNDLSNLNQFISEVQSVAPETTDLPIMYWESMKAVISAFQEAIVIALITIALLLFAIRRNIVDTLLVMTPLILAGLFTMASTVITQTPINFANIIALPLLLGLGVDNGIHMVEKLHHSLSEAQNIYQSSTARAIFYGALTTTSSFAGLAFSPHEGIASMGLIITMGIFWIMVCTFIILPAFSKLVLREKRV
jgi:hopanoid biosynthesis associated RND transporter like protein HpnN